MIIYNAEYDVNENCIQKHTYKRGPEVSYHADPQNKLSKKWDIFPIFCTKLIRPTKEAIPVFLNFQILGIITLVVLTLFKIHAILAQSLRSKE